MIEEKKAVKVTKNFKIKREVGVKYMQKCIYMNCAISCANYADAYIFMQCTERLQHID